MKSAHCAPSVCAMRRTWPLAGTLTMTRFGLVSPGGMLRLEAVGRVSPVGQTVTNVPAVGATAVHLGIDPDRRTEQDEALVDQVCAEVEQGAAARPAGTARRGVPLEPGLEAVDLAQGPVVDKGPHRQEVGVPAPVEEDREGDPAPLGLGVARGRMASTVEEAQAVVRRAGLSCRVLNARVAPLLPAGLPDACEVLTVRALRRSLASSTRSARIASSRGKP